MCEVIAVCKYHDGIYIFCTDGSVYRMDVGDTVFNVKFTLVGRLELNAD